MPYPYFQPIQPWVISVLNERENNKLLNIYKNPFVIITSGAKVVQSGAKVAAPNSKERIDYIMGLLGDNGANAKDEWRGCIIANSIGTNIDKASSEDIRDLTYSLGATPVGIDFNGKVIKVDGETGRKVSMPIIETLDIDTDGANNTLKIANLTVRCFTLKQLEMFEMFFLKPGMNILVEFGDTTLSARKRPGIMGTSAAPGQSRTESDKLYYVKDGKQADLKEYGDISQALIDKSNYSNFCKNFSAYFRADTQAIGEYLKTVRKSLGSYDRVAGIVTQFSYTIDTDGTYVAQFEVSQGNQVSFAVAAKGAGSTKSTQKSGPTKDVDFDDFDVIQKIVINDFGLNETAFTTMLNKRKSDLTKGTEWKDNFFNFVKINKQQKDTAASQKSYISLRFVLSVLLNYYQEASTVSNNDKFFELQLPKYRKSPTDKDADALTILPVQNNPYLISSDESIIIPKKTLVAAVAPKKDSSKNAAEVFLDKGKIDGTINGYNFDYSTDKATKLYHLEASQLAEPEIQSTEYGFGDALNIFLDYREVVSFWNNSYSRIEFLEKILAMVNDNSYGLFHLIFGVQDEITKINTIINDRYIEPKIDDKKIYRFKPTTIDSIVKNFNFNFEMDNLVASMTIFNSRAVLKAAKDKLDPKQAPNVGIGLPPEAVRSVDYGLYANADGWFAINQIEYENLLKTNETVNKETAAGITKDPPKKEEDTNPVDDLNAVVNSKSIRFLNPKNEKQNRVLIYMHKDFVMKYITTEKNDKPTLSPITISVTIDGFSGFNCGQYFEIDGIPEIYNRIGVFQITNIKHNVAEDGWTTTIEADHKILDKK
jgi:hypothetical protein